MDKVLGSRFLIANAITADISKNGSQELDYPFYEVYDDVVRDVTNFWQEQNLDRRAIAVGSDYYMHVWDILAGKPAGWREMVYFGLGVYSEMLVDIKQPATALIASPDRKFNFVAYCASKGIEMTFLNNDCLYNFENFVLNHPEFNFDINYTVLDMQEFEEMNTPQFDYCEFITMDVGTSPELIDTYINVTNPGGVLYMANANEMMRMYSPDYYIEPIYDFYEYIEDRTDITSYHIPHQVGFHIMIKK